MLLAFAVYLAAMLLAGWWASRRVRTASDFILGGRSLNPWITALATGASDRSRWLLPACPMRSTPPGSARPDAVRLLPAPMVVIQAAGGPTDALATIAAVDAARLDPFAGATVVGVMSQSRCPRSPRRRFGSRPIRATGCWTSESCAWAGFGAAFGPLEILALRWQRMTATGALAGMLTGAATVLV